jgi:hypothetical protein
MTTTYSPTSLGFGNVATNNTVSQQVTVSNTGSQPVTLSLSGAGKGKYTLSPTSVPANGSVVVTVSFKPTDTTSYSAQIDDGTGSCSLTGNGVDPSTLTGAGSDPNQFETEFAAGASPDAGVKYYQIAVPNFQDVGAPSGVTIPTKLSDGTTAIPTFTGSSFLRIGSSPSPTNWSDSTYQNSLNLARLVGDPAQIMGVEDITVGGAGTITSTAYNDGNASTLAPPGTTTFLDAFVDGRGVQTPGFGTNQDPNFLLGFADDVRSHGALPTSSTPNPEHAAKTIVNGAAVDNTNQNRQAETLRLLTKGGWWDHSDGNRITTTAGDKLEVIQGNYKIMVLGRQPAPKVPGTYVDLTTCYTQSTSLNGALVAWYADQSNQTKINAVNTAWTQTNPSASQVRDQYKYEQDAAAVTTNTFLTDLSGGHFQEQYPSPTPCIKTIEYVQDDTGTWTLYQDNGLGNLITKLKGRTVDLFQGASRETYVGSNDKTKLWDQGGASPKDATNTTTSDLRLDPMIASFTWAQSVYTQTGSADKPIGFGAASSNPSQNKSSAGPQPTGAPSGGVQNGDVYSQTWAQRVISYTGSSTNKVSYVYSETNANTVKSVTNVGATTVYSEINDGGLGNIVNLTKAGSITGLTAAFHIMDMSIALKTTIAASFARDIYLGGKFSFTFGIGSDFRIGPKEELISSAATTLVIGDDVSIKETAADLALTLLLGI